MNGKIAKSERKIGSKAGLAVILSNLRGFDEAKVRLEQYPTDGDTAADILWNMYILGDIKEKVIVDLGAGSGILGIGASLLGGKEVILVEIDNNALEIAKSNISKLKSEGFRIGKIRIERKDISSFGEKEDVVIENPPFGTKVRHQDKCFLEKAIKIASVVYTLHKSENKAYFERFAARNSLRITHVWNYKLPLKAAFEFHRRKIHRINVSCFRFVRIPKIFK